MIWFPAPGRNQRRLREQRTTRTFPFIGGWQSCKSSIWFWFVDMLTTLGFQSLAFVLVVARRAVRALFPFSLDVLTCWHRFVSSPGRNRRPWQQKNPRTFVSLLLSELRELLYVSDCKSPGHESWKLIDTGYGAEIAMRCGFAVFQQFTVSFGCCGRDMNQANTRYWLSTCPSTCSLSLNFGLTAAVICAVAGEAAVMCWKHCWSPKRFRAVRAARTQYDFKNIYSGWELSGMSGLTVTLRGAWRVSMLPVWLFRKFEHPSESDDEFDNRTFRDMGIGTFLLVGRTWRLSDGCVEFVL